MMNGGIQESEVGLTTKMRRHDEIQSMDRRIAAVERSALIVRALAHVDGGA